MSLLALLLLAPPAVRAAGPQFSWDYVANMTFFHSCNESGLFSERALDTIQRFPIVTIEKGQSYNSNATGEFAEDKIVAQLRAVKERNPKIMTVFYVNAVLSWYFYRMNVEYEQMPKEWLYNSYTGQPVRESGDKTFNPPPGGMLVWNHGLKEVQTFWKDTCLNATKTGFVDGCFSDSSQPGSHGTGKALNDSAQIVYEAGKVKTMSEVTAAFGGEAGKPFAGSTGVLIGKKSDQEGINAYQIEFFEPNDGSITELMAGVSKGYFVQAHTGVGNACNCGTDCMKDSLAAFLIGAGEYSYFGGGKWIAKDLADVESRWCPELFEQPLGKPDADAVKGNDGIWRRSFASGTKVEFDSNTKKGKLIWGTKGL